MELYVLEKNNQRVLTTNQIAESFKTDSKAINRNFQRNTERYIQGKHYFSLSGEELKEFKGSRQIDANLKYVSVLYLWTEKGAWLHAKSLNNDQAWDAYEMLVDEYYRIQNQVKVLTEKEKIQASMKLSLDNSIELEDVKKEVGEIRGMVENQITLDHGEQRRLQIAIATKVYEIETEQPKQGKLFSGLHREIKDRCGVSSYKDVKRKELQSVLRYVESWIPKKECLNK